MRVAWPWGSLPGISTPASSLTTVPVRAGVTEVTANWATVQHLTEPHPRSPAASVRVGRRLYPNGISTGMVCSIFSKHIPTLIIENLRSLPEMTTPAPSLTTVLCRAGGGDYRAIWVMEERLTKPHPRSPAASVQVAQQ